MKLSNNAWMGLGIYIGFKSPYRTEEMKRIGVNIEDFKMEVTNAGIMKGGRINVKHARGIWEGRFGNILPSQTHMYRESLGFTY